MFYIWTWTKLYRSVFILKAIFFITLEDFKAQLNRIKTIVVEQHQSFRSIRGFNYQSKFIWFHFASLDIRQNSKIHDKFSRMYTISIFGSNVYFRRTTMIFRGKKNLTCFQKLKEILIQLILQTRLRDLLLNRSSN
jgi:hypothetical protein